MSPKCSLTNFAPGRGTSFEETDSPTRRACRVVVLFTRRVCLWAALGLFVALAFVAQPACAAVTEAWVHRYNYNAMSNSVDLAFKVVCDAAGDIIVTGTTDDGITGNDVRTIKYSGADGSVLWQKRYNGPADGEDRAQAVAVDGSDNVVVTGTSEGERGNFDYYTVKYAATDALLWEKRSTARARHESPTNERKRSHENKTNKFGGTGKYALGVASSPPTARPKAPRFPSRPPTSSFG